MKNALLLIAVAAIVSLMVAPTRAADINVGLITAMTGPGASMASPMPRARLPASPTRTVSTAPSSI